MNFKSEWCVALVACFALLICLILLLNDYDGVITGFVGSIIGFYFGRLVKTPDSGGNN